MMESTLFVVMKIVLLSDCDTAIVILTMVGAEQLLRDSLIDVLVDFAEPGCKLITYSNNNM